ncbi:MAG: tetratricopeptide repeat protein [Chloroflexi bacterium]|nr:tetratricopeptide repeat protein [Chloroflexota bacterium]
MRLLRREKVEKKIAAAADPEEAIAHFQRLVEENPQDAQARFNLGSTYYVLGQYDAAARELEKAVTHDSDHLDSHYYLGLIYARRGEKEKARRELEIVAQKEPRLMMRGYAEWKTKQLDS